MKNIFTVILGVLFAVGLGISREHPCLFICKEEAQVIKRGIDKFPLLRRSYIELRKKVDDALKRPIEVPPPGEAGGYEHERHKNNYREIWAAGLLYQITGNKEYAEFIKRMLEKYAEMYPKLGPSPYAYNQAPGKIFHQALNECVWLTYTIQAYDCIYNYLRPKERKVFEENIFVPMAEWLSLENSEEFNRIHNHGTWAVTAVGMTGLVIGNEDFVQMALYGTEKDGEGGFLKQLDLLFSPDGYYMEGPYYVRYALRPFFFFAEALERNRPELKIYAYRDSILKKAYYSAILTIFPDGVFPPINDASLTMDIRDIGMIISTDIVSYRYGIDTLILGIKKYQNSVILNKCGYGVAKEFGDGADVRYPKLPSIEFRDGYNGERGGLGILRRYKGDDGVMLLMKYGVQGGGHGHFDKLHFILYDQMKMVIPDYGFARWINIEPKFGGRYLPENSSYAKQTVAHNVVVVDMISQNRANRKEAEKFYARRHFFDSSNPEIQVVSAIGEDQYPGVKMIRTMFLISENADENYFLVDIYRLFSKDKHTYDYTLHYDGYFINTNWKLRSYSKVLKPLGKDFGYQHLWKEAEAKGSEDFIFTWLSSNRYYSFITDYKNSGDRVYFVRIGANDPKFNLRREPGLIYRVKGDTTVFASIIERHGYFNEAREMSDNPYPAFESVKVIGNNEKATAIELKKKDGEKWVIVVTNEKGDKEKEREVMFNGIVYKWKGNYNILKNGSKIW